MVNLNKTTNGKAIVAAMAEWDKIAGNSEVTVITPGKATTTAIRKEIPTVTLDAKLEKQLVAFTNCAISVAQQEAKSKGKDYKGLHVVFSGFNSALETQFKLEHGSAPSVVKALVDKKLFTSRPTFKGVLLYRNDEAPKARESTEARGNKFLQRMRAMK
jgi:intracellular sulfur oxidation DsrE/DsrF family protein